MDSDWAGLPGFLFTLPLSALVVTIGLLPAVAGRYGHVRTFYKSEALTEV